MRWILVATALLALGACSGGMDKAECRTADWRAVGYEDGSKGYRADNFGKRRKACAEHGITANFSIYQAGHAEGQAVYCRPRNGYVLGTQGYRYASICPPELDGAFAAAHADGFGLYQRKVAVSNVGKRINNSKQRIRSIESSMNRKTMMLSSPRIRFTERASLAMDIRRLAEEKVEVQQSIPELEQEYATAQREYDGYRGAVANRY